jgi:hypothetical protein
MDDRCVKISLGEGMLIVPGADVSDLAADLDVMAELGVAQVNSLSFDPDRNGHGAGCHRTRRQARSPTGGGTMHWVRSGYGAVDLRELGPEKIGYVQLSDTTLKPRVKSYMEEAMYQRMAPGDGELPLAEILTAVPADVVIGLEIPMRGLAESGMGPWSAFDQLWRRLVNCVIAEAVSLTIFRL